MSDHFEAQNGPDEPEAEDVTYEAQREYILAEFGEEAADTANYGWGVDEIVGVIATKVYGHGVLTTAIGETDDHEFEPFREESCG